MNQRSIYEIRLFSRDPMINYSVGFFHELKNTENAVMCNSGDMSEIGYYPVACIKKCSPGTFNYKEPVGWYLFNYDTSKDPPQLDSVEKIERPEWIPFHFG